METDRTSDTSQIEADILHFFALYNYVKVIKNVGNFSHVITLKFFKGDTASLKIQVDAETQKTTIAFIGSKYPTPPDLQQIIQRHGSETSVSLREKVESIKADLISAGEINQQDGTGTSSQQTTGKKPEQNKKSKSKTQDVSTCSKKKPSMKTADDVVKRILWDDGISKMDFTIGYLDRFLGVLEKKFDDFNWADLATISHLDLAIPKHRIQYFKYRKRVVWRKADRLDLVFGSVGSGIKIQDVVASYVEWEAENPQEAAEPATRLTRNDSDDSEYDSDDDDDMVIGIGSLDMQPVAARNDADWWENKLRPNHFLALRITNEQVRQRVAEFQRYMVAQEPVYQECIMPEAMLHVTVCMLGLDDDVQVGECIDAMRQNRSIMLANFGPDYKPELELKGIGAFFGRVLYAKVPHSDKLVTFGENVRMLMSERGVKIRDQHEFVPHMTLMKITRPAGRKLRQSFIDPLSYKKYENFDFGTAALQDLSLCVISDARGDDGFYETKFSIPVNQAPPDN